MFDKSEQLGEIVVDADDHEEAAVRAMESWSDGGSFAGDPFPEHMELLVAPAGKPWRLVTVSVDWEPVFHAHDRGEDRG